MSKRRWGANLVATLVVMLALAACGSGSGRNASNTAAMPAASGAAVSAQQVGDAGTVLVDANGQALYASEQEAGGKVLCTGPCLSFWTPLTVKSAPSGSSLPGKLAVVKRPDGGNQLTYNGKLLYSFSEDSPGEVSGDGFSDAFGGQQFTWHVVHANGADDSSGGSGSTGTNTGGGIYGY